MHTIQTNHISHIIVALLMLATIACKHSTPKNEVNSKHIRESCQRTRLDSLINAVRHFNPTLQLNLAETKKLKEFSNTVFLYISDAHCYSCVETILKETQLFINRNSSASVSVIYSASNRNSFYSFKRAFYASGINFFLLERENAFQEDFRLAFYFELDNESQVHSVFIPEDSDITIPEYLIQTMNLTRTSEYLVCCN